MKLNGINFSKQIKQIRADIPVIISTGDRSTLEKEEYERNIEELQIAIKNGEKKRVIYIHNNKQEKYTDLYLKQILNQLDLLEIDIVNKTIHLNIRFLFSTLYQQESIAKLPDMCML